MDCPHCGQEIFLELCRPDDDDDDDDEEEQEGQGPLNLRFRVGD